MPWTSRWEQLESEIPIPTPPFSCDYTGRNRFCSLSWYDRQLIDNSRGGGDEKEASPTSDEAGEAGEKEGPPEAAVDGASTLSPPARLHSSDGGFGVRARPADASVLATLKVRDIDFVDPMLLCKKS